jgi:hypothetical protein
VKSKVETRVYQGDVAYRPKLWLFDEANESVIILDFSDLSRTAWVRGHVTVFQHLGGIGATLGARESSGCHPL